MCLVVRKRHMAFTAVHGGRLHEGEFHTHVYARVCICILRWEVAPIHAGGCSILLGNLRSTCAPLIGSTLGPIGIHTCSESDYLCVSVQASPILQICHWAPKTQCLGSHLPRPLVVYTTMTMKVCKDGHWQKFYPPSRGKGCLDRWTTRGRQRSLTLEWQH